MKYRSKVDGDFLELLLISAVSSIFAIRALLRLTGYPQLGGEVLHVAHVLWGGLMMVSAIIFALSFSGKRALQIVAILGGVGFGTFIDELGKFITADNDYFFQPTIAILYLVFLAAFSLIRLITTHGHRVEDYLERFYLQKLYILSLVKKKGRSLITSIATNIWFQKAVIVFLFLTAFFGIIDTIYTLSVAIFWPNNLEHWAGLSLTPMSLGEQMSGAMAVAFAVIGVYFYNRDRLKALTFFKYSVMVTILITQFFLFYRNQLGAVYKLFFALALLIVIRTMIQETAHQKLKSSNIMRRL